MESGKYNVCQVGSQDKQTLDKCGWKQTLRSGLHSLIGKYICLMYFFIYYFDNFMRELKYSRYEKYISVMRLFFYLLLIMFNFLVDSLHGLV